MLAAATAAASAQTYPNRPVKIVVPYSAGGGTDALTRFIARGLEQRLGQPFIIENRGGSGTTLGAAMVARADADGYTLLMGTSATFAIAPGLYQRLAYDPTKDFTPIMLVATVPFVLTVHPSLGVKTAAELVALAKSKPGQLSYASGGPGAPHHIYAELLKSMTGIDIKHVPYRGGGPALNDVVAGHVPIYFADAGPAAPLVNSGKLIALGVTTADARQQHAERADAARSRHHRIRSQLLADDGRAAEHARAGVDAGQPGACRVHADAGSTEALHLARHAADDRHAGRGGGLYPVGGSALDADHQGYGLERGISGSLTGTKPGGRMRKHLKIGLVVPFATDKVPVEGPLMYPGRDVHPARRRRARADAGGL